MVPAEEMVGSRVAYVRQMPKRSSAAKLDVSKTLGRYILVVVVQELDRVIDKECRPGNPG